MSTGIAWKSVLAIVTVLSVGIASVGGAAWWQVARADDAVVVEATDDEYDDGTPAAVRAREKRIAESLETLGPHPWAGEYYRGDGLGMNVRLLVSPTAGASVTWHGCMGLYGANEGNLVMGPDGVLRFGFSLENREGEFGAFPTSLVPVRWGDRHYLLEPGELPQFVNSVNLGREPRTRVNGQFLLRDGDENRAATGLPEIPPQYRSLIRAEPARFRILDVRSGPPRCNEHYCETTHRVTFDTRGDPAIVRGTELGVEEYGDYPYASVVRIDGSLATAEVTRIDGLRKKALVPEAGWTLSTGVSVTK